MGITFAALALLGVAGSGVADPLHKFGHDGAWRHVDSGWMFPASVSGFSRVGQPYNIDGNNDAGAEYRPASGSSVSAEVDVYAADSGAPDATLDGAKSTAARKAGESAGVSSEQPFQIDTLKGVRGVKVRHAGTEAAGTLTNLYFFTTERWRVKVLANSAATGKDGDAALDAFVQALPWETLGSESGIH
ncbi:hypothetical protein [Steroidobacter sp.]|uniref:hypothetical protein n=1 Tax=Steroidobacter sp. TaxID=1978227 RepID=UPI001A60B5E8|nr:hypothetical protein [Steroidobacter sp.]MBL8268758.1 hypothetical protein [Steroidobacter sp.]